MKAVISYRYNGEIIDKLEALLLNVSTALKNAGVDPYCIFLGYRSKANCRKPPAEMMHIAFSNIDKTDLLFVIQTGEARSEGMLMEVGYAIAKGVCVVVATKNGVENTYLPSMANYSIIYENIEDLMLQINNINFSSLIARGGFIASQDVSVANISA